jgi:O-antigen ligase
MFYNFENRKNLFNLYLVPHLAIILILSVFIFENQFKLAGLAITIYLTIFFLLSIFNKNGASNFTSIIFVLSPYIMILRQNIISYNGVSIILLIALTMWFLKENHIFLSTLFYFKFLYVFLFFLTFIVYGLVIGNELKGFMKYVETILSATLFLIFLRNIDYFKKYSIYYILSIIFLVISFSQHIETRYIIIDEYSEFKVDPSNMSISLIFAFLLLIVDDSKFVSFNKSKFFFFRLINLKNILIITLLILVVLTTSRVGLFVILGVSLVVFLLSKEKIKSLILISITLSAIFIFIANSSYFEIVNFWIDKTISNEKGVAAASSGRSEQWRMAGFYLLNENPLKVLKGVGPGNGGNFSTVYSTKIDVIDSMSGKAYQLHSLYLNVLIEFGLIAFALFAFFIISRLINLYRLYIITGYQLPLMALISYVIYIFSVSGLGIVPGIFISFILLNKNFFNNYEFSK